MESFYKALYKAESANEDYQNHSKNGNSNMGRNRNPYGSGCGQWSRKSGNDKRKRDTDRAKTEGRGSPSVFQTFLLLCHYIALQIIIGTEYGRLIMFSNISCFPLFLKV